MTETSTEPPESSAAHAAESSARRAFDHVHSDPAAAMVVLRGLVDDPATPPLARMVASWGLGRALHDAGDVARAGELFAAAIEIAGEIGAASEEPAIRMSWATALQTAGDDAAALAQLALAEPLVGGGMLGRLLTQRGSFLMQLGDNEHAVEQYDAAATLLRDAGDRLGEMRLLCNRGVALTRLGRTAAAQADFELAERLSAEDGQHLLVATAQQNLGFLESRLGRWPQALARMAQARGRYHQLGSPGRFLASLDADECELLLHSGFPAEAKEMAEAVIANAGGSGDVLQLAEGNLLLARALNLLGSMPAAAAAATTAATLFRSTGRQAWAASADYVAAMSDAEVDGRRALARLGRAADTLEEHGWAGEAAEVRVRMARIALDSGQTDEARSLLLATSSSRRTGSARQRAGAWYAAALLHVLDEEPAKARRAIDAGLRVVDRHRAALGASDLRVRASADGVELAALGVRLALQRGRARDVFLAAERWRAGSLADRTGAIVGERSVDHDLAELRRLERRLREIGVSTTARPHRGAGAVTSEVSAARRELLRLERQITVATRVQPGDPRALGRRLDIVALRRQLGAATLVEYVDVDGALHATVVTARTTRLVTLAPIEEVVREMAYLTFEIRRLSTLSPLDGRAAAAMASWRQIAGELDALIVAPLRLPDGPVVVVPTGPLHSLAWSSLPGMQRPDGVTIAPSAAWWMGPVGPGPVADGVVLVHGPGLPHASAELAAIAAAVDRPIVLTGADATTSRVREAIAGAGFVHIAAHGSFRADNPMFSALHLADGPLYVHDLERLVARPHTVVLTACNAGRSGVYGGDELLGTAAALLALGVRSVVAPLLPVRDEATAPFAAELHRELAAGATAAAALARVSIAAMTSEDPALVATAASFQCLGRRAAE
jgi:tetratricopeptide (TPR) repeat protein